MGLDWNPASKARPGFEREYDGLCEDLSKKWCFRRKAKEELFHEISFSAFETLNAPRVGVDERANAWARERYTEQTTDLSLEEWLSKIHGLYVVDLVRPCDGVPRYTNGTPAGYVEPFSFRAQFLRDCEAIIGPELLEAAYQNMKPKALSTFGQSLERSAQAFAASKGIDLEAIHEPDDPDSVEFQLDVVRAAARWCEFWAGNGHPLEAYW